MKPENPTGSLTLTIRRGDSLVVTVPGCEPFSVTLIDVAHGRATMNVRAPRDYKIDRDRRAADKR